MKYQIGDIIIDELKGFNTYIGLIIDNSDDLHCVYWFNIGKLHNTDKYMYRQTRLFIKSNKFTRLICTTL